MDQDWLAHVRTYAADADEAVVKKIVNYCGIALRNRDSSLVSFADPAETARVRENYLRKKLALTDDDATLDSGIARIGERMAGDTAKNRVTVYYLLADHFDRLDVFGGTGRGTGVGGTAAGTAAAVGLAAMPEPEPVPATAPEPTVAAAASATPSEASSPVAAASLASPAATAPASRSAHDRNSQRRGAVEDDGIVQTGCLAAAAVVGAIVVAGLLALWMSRDDEAVAPPAPPAPVAAPAAPDAAEPAASEAAPAGVPQGAGVVAGERAGLPMVTTYFDTAQAEVTAEFANAAAPVVAYLKANPKAKVAISGFNDPTGDAAANAELSKNRAQAVRAALVALGVPEAQTSLVKPDETTTEDVTPEQARRVELTIGG